MSLDNSSQSESNPNTQALSSAELETRHDDFGRGSATWHHIGDSSLPSLYFLSANGHAVSTYRFFLRRLAERYSVEALDNRAVWPGVGEPERFYPWSELIEDYQAFLNFRGVAAGQLTHVGHSLGGSLGVMLALQRPELFKKLVVIEPGTVPSWLMANLFRYAPLALKKKIPFVKGTINRRSQFPDADTFMQSMRKKAPYRGFSDEAMRDYAEGGLVASAEGLTLRYPGAWEGQNFCGAPYVWSLIPKLRVPTLVLKAENTYLLGQESYQKLQQRCQRQAPLVEFRELPGVSHMAIQDDPDLVRDAVFDWLQD